MDLDGIFGFDEEEEPDHLGPPDFRATIHDGELLVTNWAPYLLNGGGPYPPDGPRAGRRRSDDRRHVAERR